MWQQGKLYSDIQFEYSTNALAEMRLRYFFGFHRKIDEIWYPYILDVFMSFKFRILQQFHIFSQKIQHRAK